mmetsp:Transcript_2964/g.6601  ORF Transcript_2964/g.6601 Transcript_2964/m.6601 type:complete len:211 (+) Transcript_2964:172-804(+)
MRGTSCPTGTSGGRACISRACKNVAGRSLMFPKESELLCLIFWLENCRQRHARGRPFFLLFDGECERMVVDESPRGGRPGPGVDGDGHDTGVCILTPSKGIPPRSDVQRSTPKGSGTASSCGSEGCLKHAAGNGLDEAVSKEGCGELASRGEGVQRGGGTKLVLCLLGVAWSSVLAAGVVTGFILQSKTKTQGPRQPIVYWWDGKPPIEV